MYDGFFDTATCPAHVILDLVIRMIRIMLKYILNVVWNVDWINVARVKGQDRSFVISINGNYLFARWVTIRPHSHCQPSWAEPNRTEPTRTDSAWKTNLRYEMEAFTLHAEPNRAKPNRTEPDRVCSLADVCFYSPADDRFCCAIGLTSWGWSACAPRNVSFQ